MHHLRPVFPHYFSLWNDLPIWLGYQTGVLLCYCCFLLYGCRSVTQSCLILCDPVDCNTPGFPVDHHQELAQAHVHWVSDAIQLSYPCHPLLLLLEIFPSIRVSSNESALHIRWPKYWRFSFSISPSKEYSRLISFDIDWFDFPAVQETLKNLLQHHLLKASQHQSFWTFDAFIPCCLNDRNLFSHSSGVQRSKVKVLAGLVFSESPLLNLQTAVFSPFLYNIFPLSLYLFS